MEFVQIAQDREEMIRRMKLDRIPIVGDGMLYAEIKSYTGPSIEMVNLDGADMQSIYCVTAKKAKAEIYTSDTYFHYILCDDNGYIRTFSMARSSNYTTEKFRKAATAFGILKGDYKLPKP